MPGKSLSHIARRGAPWLVALLLLSLATPAGAVRIVCYNLLNYSSGRTTEFRAILSAVNPDVVIVQEVGGSTGYTNFLTTVLNGPGGPGGFGGATFSDGPDTDNALYFKGSRITYVAAPPDHMVIATTPRQTDRWRIGLKDYASDAAKLYVYSMHLKAGSSAQDEADRTAAATLIRANANNLPAGTHFVYAGDLNITNSTVGAYVQFTGSQANNNGRAFDPINMPGFWNNNSAFAAIHTQSTHNDNPGAPSGAATGGLDDRFDFILVSAAMNDGDGMSYVTTTYKAYGNDGQHFNKDINDPPVIPEGATMANHLHGASDHLPVIMDVRAPAVISATASLDFGTVLIGTIAQQTLTVANVGNVALFGFVDDLDYSLAAPAGFAAPGGAFSDAAGGGSNTHAVTMNTSTPGAKSGNLVINSNDPDNPMVNVALSGLVIPRGDLSRNGAVDGPDLPLFVALLLDPGSATGEDLVIADMNEDTANDGRDIPGFTAALLP